MVAAITGIGGCTEKLLQTSIYDECGFCYRSECSQQLYDSVRWDSKSIGCLVGKDLWCANIIAFDGVYKAGYCGSRFTGIIVARKI